MGINDILDEAIKKQELLDKINLAYNLNGKEYKNYMDNDAWMKFISDMKLNYPEAYKAYGNGNGDELGLKGDSMVPPKMASYGSSSRMIFNLAKKIKGFEFEKKLSTTLGGVANLDGFMETDETLIFVEAKCREPYSSHKDTISMKYKELYQYLNDKNVFPFKVKMNDLNNGQMYVEFILNNKQIECFDLKQMLCHLLGIATMLLKQPVEKKIKFIYLLYNPTLILIEDKKAEKIYEKYSLCCKECNEIDFVKVFAAVISFLQEEKGIGIVSYDEIEKIVKNFTFTLCDQSNFGDLVR